MNNEDRALCAEPEVDIELFFSPFEESSRDAKLRFAGAKRICAECPIKKECLQGALDRGEYFGVWGGVDEVQLRRSQAIDLNNKPYRHKGPMLCPHCKTTDTAILEIVRQDRNKTKLRCNFCDITWTAKKNIEL